MVSYLHQTYFIISGILLLGISSWACAVDDQQDAAMIKQAREVLIKKYYQNLAKSKVLYHFKTPNGAKEVELSYLRQQYFYAALEGQEKVVYALEEATEIAPVEQILKEEQLAKDDPWGKVVQAKVDQAKEFLAHPQQVKDLKLKTWQIAQEAQQLLKQALAHAETPANHRAMDFLRQRLWPIPQDKIKLLPLGNDIAIDTHQQQLVIGQHLGRDLPPAALLLAFAHEWGHSLGPGCYLGYCNPYFAEEESNAVVRSAKMTVDDHAHHQIPSAQGHTLANYPLGQDLKRYRALGVSGLDYLDPAHQKRWEKCVKLIYQQLNGKADYTLVDDIGGMPIIERDMSRLIPAMVLANTVLGEFHLIEEQLDHDVSPATWVVRINEVTADHFAKLALEEKAITIKDKKQRQQFVEEALLSFLWYIDLRDVWELKDIYPELLWPTLQAWYQEMQQGDDSAKKALWCQTWDEQCLLNDHPTTQERLTIFLSSPVLRQAILFDHAVQ